jgi:anti-sigma factor RsiW
MYFWVSPTLYLGKVDNVGHPNWSNIVKIFSPHIRFEQLADLVEGRLPPEEQSRLRAHISTCPNCAAELAWLEKVIDLMRADAGEDAPPAAVARARRLLRSHPAVAPSERRRIPALLQFDSRQQPLALGMRSDQPAARQLLLKADEYDLDLRLTPAGAAWQLSGQVLGPDAAGQVEQAGEAGLAQAGLNELGEFSLPPTSPGVYRLILRLDNLDVEFPRLEIGA